MWEGTVQTKHVSTIQLFHYIEQNVNFLLTKSKFEVSANQGSLGISLGKILNVRFFNLQNILLSPFIVQILFCVATLLHTTLPRRLNSTTSTLLLPS